MLSSDVILSKTTLKKTHNKRPLQITRGEIELSQLIDSLETLGNYPVCGWVYKTTVEKSELLNLAILESEHFPFGTMTWPIFLDIIKKWIKKTQY